MVNFGITLSNLSTYIQVSNRNRIEREKLAISLQEQLSSEINTIDAEILDLQRDSIALAYEYQNITLLEELNTIKLKQYDHYYHQYQYPALGIHSHRYIDLWSILE
ncbi:hypothetical protein JSO59_001530 [Riemerella anatipestifer]